MVELQVQSRTDNEQILFSPTTLVVAGWTGRDAAAVEAHITELAELGIARPRSVPIFYRVAAALLTTAPVIEVVGREASGEIETVLLKHEGRIFVGVGSDHTDRKLEMAGITLSKQLCAKPIGPTVWLWSEVENHWDELIFRSIIDDDVLYQEGSTTALRRPDDLLSLYERSHGELPNGGVMFCGTIPVIGGIRFADQMRLELIDPNEGRALDHRYRLEVLPMAEASP